LQCISCISKEQCCCILRGVWGMPHKVRQICIFSQFGGNTYKYECKHCRSANESWYVYIHIYKHKYRADYFCHSGVCLYFAVLAAHHTHERVVSRIRMSHVTRMHTYEHSMTFPTYPYEWDYMCRMTHLYVCRTRAKKQFCCLWLRVCVAVCCAVCCSVCCNVCCSVYGRGNAVVFC